MNLDKTRTNSDELFVIPNIYNESQNLLDIAPGENKVLESFLMTIFVKSKHFHFYYQKESSVIKFLGQYNCHQLNTSTKGC